MKDVREMFNISYFDNKELSLKEHCDIYSNIKRDLISILNKYDIKYVLAETEVIKDLSKENKELKKQLEEYQLQNIDLRADIMIQKKAFPNKLIKDKTFYDLYDMPIYEDLLNQQKEFIKYLEDLIKQNETVVEVSKYGLPKNCSKLLIDFYKQILQKYKEIIGDVK